MSMTPQLAWRLDCQLGEGPVWLARENALRFVDIKRGHLHRFDPASGVGETVDVGGNPSFVVPAADGTLLVGDRHAVRGFDGAALGAPVASLDQPAHNRTNDATVDGDGRLWLGTMDDGEQAPTGTIWCLDRGQLHASPVHAVVTNGPAVSGDVLYHVDSGARTVFRSRIDGPKLAGTEVFVAIDPADGHPDGVIVDAEDCLWVGLWDGWGVRRYAPDGRLLAHIKFPCARVTKVALGGPDLRTAFVTTARVGLSEADLAQQPLAGSLFAFEAPAPGRVLPEVRLA
jgi:sugar lactone lactonase YvrE